ncbi:hypothetical protein J1N10_06220 [Carboxylicivirga sp. A043]|uniref:hypothetical protein n=1 Tax=Carboxylicivirga litoralis TaxID=2816963 RepID=UPI0021CB48AB|nr:hypothetical protein [Carboxylicivirga sp. A043]MCU4155564.1 hypothetical protein [Carboxylicivirga sp. A043]
MTAHKPIISTLTILTLSLSSFAQSHFKIQAGAAVPLAKFAKFDNGAEGNGAAVTGFSLGLQYNYDIPQSRLGTFIGADIHYNGLQDEYKKNFEQFKPFYPDTYYAQFSKYINIPLSAGLIYTKGFGHSWGVTSEAGLVYNIFKITDTKFKYDTHAFYRETDLATNLGFRLGLGLTWHQRYYVSLNYFGLGQHEISGHFTADGEAGEFEAKQTVDLLAISLGFRI